VRAERRELTLDHASAGAMLLERWGVAGSVVEAVGGHHDEDRGRDAAVVRLADMLGHYATGEAVDGGALLAVARGLGLEGAELRAVMFDLHAPAPVASGPGGRPEPAEPSPFTPRELDALRGLAAGGTYKEIAEELGLSTSTLRSHLHNVYGKLGVADRAQAVLMAAERGWL
jgi:DNA-binding CsgD family transcriptional regulator